jgi:ferredoxin-NADP reductase
VTTWRVAIVAATERLTPSARSIALDVPGWTGNVAGQHLDLRLTAEDGYQAVRSYSIASVGTGERVELGVDQVPEGEVSPYLVDDLLVGDQLEIRGPLGGWFVWRPTDTGPVQLIAGGSGIVPLVAMIRSRRVSSSSTPFRLLYSVRTPEDVMFASELSRPGDVDVTFAYTRRVPDGFARKAKRLDRSDLAHLALPPGEDLTVFVCGPTGFVESVADGLVSLGHDPARVKTERFGGA